MQVDELFLKWPKHILEGANKHIGSQLQQQIITSLFMFCPLEIMVIMASCDKLFK